MFAYIKGNIGYVAKDFFVMEVDGLGFKILANASTLGRLNSIKDPVKVHTHLHVREDAMTLYGFLCDEELRLFQQLIGVSGIGPKVGLAVLSTMTPAQFAMSLLTNDINNLVKVPGVGKKTAQRIILELKDKIKQGDIARQLDVPPQADNNKGEALNALIALGYTIQEAEKAVARVHREDHDTETLIKLALRELANLE